MLAACRRERLLPRDSTLGSPFEGQRGAPDALLPSHSVKNGGDKLLSDRLLGVMNQTYDRGVGAITGGSSPWTSRTRSSAESAPRGLYAAGRRGSGTAG